MTDNELLRVITNALEPVISILKNVVSEHSEKLQRIG